MKETIYDFLKPFCHFTNKSLSYPDCEVKRNKEKKPVYYLILNLTDINPNYIHNIFLSTLFLFCFDNIGIYPHKEAAISFAFKIKA